MLTLLLGNRMLNSVATASSDICDETRKQSLSFVLNSNSYGVFFQKESMGDIHIFVICKTNIFIPATQQYQSLSKDREGNLNFN